MLQSSDRAKNWLDPAGEVVSGKAKVPERFEFNESVKLQLTDECETFKDDSGDKKKSVSENGGLGLTKLECIWLPRK